MRGPPQRDSWSAAAGCSSDFGRLCTHERADVARGHHDGVDTGAFERGDLVARRRMELRDRELSRRDVRKQLEDVVERIGVGVERRAAEHEDLGVDVFEHLAELLLVASFDDAVEPELDRLVMGPRKAVPVLAESGRHDEVRVGPGRLGAVRAAVAPEDGQIGRAADGRCSCTHHDAVGPLFFCSSCCVRVADLHEHGDPVALGDRLAEPAGSSLVHAREMLTVAWTAPARGGRLRAVADEVAIRIADADRERTVALLGEHHAVGRLTYEEFLERMEKAYEARTHADLDVLTADLPAQRAVPAAAAKRRWVVSIMGGTSRNAEVADEHVVFDLMGGSDLDLRHAHFPKGEATVTAVAVMGGSTIWVPDGARVELSGFAFMGGNDNRVPPGGSGPLIRVRAWALMGGVDVRSGKRGRDRRSRHGLPSPPEPPPPP